MTDNISLGSKIEIIGWLNWRWMLKGPVISPFCQNIFFLFWTYFTPPPPSGPSLLGKSWKTDRQWTDKLSRGVLAKNNCYMLPIFKGYLFILMSFLLIFERLKDNHPCPTTQNLFKILAPGHVWTWISGYASNHATNWANLACFYHDRRKQFLFVNCSYFLRILCPKSIGINCK